MKYDVFYSGKAIDDLSDIYSYVAFHLMEPVTAKKLYGSIVSAVNTLDTFPLRCGLYENEPWQSRGLRILHVKNYLVFYTVNEEKRFVTVIRIMYGARDLDKQMNEE